MQAQVLVELKAKSLDKTFTYEIPENLLDKVKVGIRVIVPFSSRKLEGFVLEIGNYNSNYNLKEILSIVDDEPILTQELIKLGKYMSKKTLSNLINCYQTMLPKALKASYKTVINKKYETIVNLLDYNYFGKNNPQKLIIEKIKLGIVNKKELTDISISAYKTLLKNNIIEEKQQEVYRINDKKIENDKRVVLTEEQNNVVKCVVNSMNKFQPFY